MYSLELADVSGSAVIGTVGVLGHQASVGYRFFQDGALSLGLELAYLFLPSYHASTFNFSTGTSGDVSFPVAQVWSLNLRVGFDVGGF